MATTQDKDEKESPKKKGGKDLDDLKKEVPIVSPLVAAQTVIISNTVHRGLTSAKSYDPPVI